MGVAELLGVLYFLLVGGADQLVGRVRPPADVVRDCAAQGGSLEPDAGSWRCAPAEGPGLPSGEPIAPATEELVEH